MQESNIKEFVAPIDDSFHCAELKYAFSELHRAPLLRARGTLRQGAARKSSQEVPDEFESFPLDALRLIGHSSNSIRIKINYIPGNSIKSGIPCFNGQKGRIYQFKNIGIKLNS